MKHLKEVDDLLHRIRRPSLLPVPEGGIGDENLFRGIGGDKFIIEFHPANLFVREDISIEVWLLDIQKGKWHYRMLALKCPLLSGDRHLLTSLPPAFPSPPGERDRVRGLILVFLDFDFLYLNPELIELLGVHS
jgi:hypothetical protein